MFKRPWLFAAPLLLVTAILVVSLARAQSADDPGFDPNTGAIPSAVTVFSRVRLIEIDDTIFRLNTETGALSRFRGTESGRNARGTFISVAPELRDPTSGFVDIQQAGGATFLIDTVTGRTWILRQRGNSTASWVEVTTPD